MAREKDSEYVLQEIESYFNCKKRLGQKVNKLLRKHNFIDEKDRLIVCVSYCFNREANIKRFGIDIESAYNIYVTYYQDGGHQFEQYLISIDGKQIHKIQQK